MSAPPRSWGIILSGGRGSRVGADVPKQLLPLGDRTVLEHAVETFLAHPRIDEVVVVVPPDDSSTKALLSGRPVHLVHGGRERRDSTFNAVLAIEELGAETDDRVLIHDAARPFVTERIVGDVLDSLDHHAAVATLIESSDTIVRIDPATGHLVEPLVRSELRRHQTPQGFRLGTLADAHRSLQDETMSQLAATDDCTAVSHVFPDLEIGTVRGEAENFKITDALDLLVARAVLAERSRD